MHQKHITQADLVAEAEEEDAMARAIAEEVGVTQPTVKNIIDADKKRNSSEIYHRVHIGQADLVADDDEEGDKRTSAGCAQTNLSNQLPTNFYHAASSVLRLVCS